MKIIDAHMHFSDNPGFARVALAARHENTAAHLLQTFRENNIVFGIAMGTHNPGKKPGVCYPGIVDLAGEFDPEHYNQPSCIVYCAGVNGMELDRCDMESTLEEFRRVLRTKQCQVREYEWNGQTQEASYAGTVDYCSYRIDENGVIYPEKEKRTRAVFDCSEEFGFRMSVRAEQSFP